ncbi:DEAD/DEAH box helicase family protein [Deinococcus taeanensis]|uniref:type I restriction endonuclease subunit R n=1 Tax=Deinococcus taeanensis TaxID=2737050 RepID=UPI001CDCF2FB|nr:DEAD/DEAH box helicase family protein [Deinococcus taeanensis]UBV43247.1 DEAD/DEAH box helicase family protein [Deinococcus taeanensis]
MTPEQQARQVIDAQLAAAGWVVQDYKTANLFAADGVALREVPTAAGSCDYMLFWKGTAVGIVEAKPKGTSLVGVSEQTDKYTVGLPPFIQVAGTPLPFGYEANSVQVQFRDYREPDSRSRTVFHFHRPETLGAWLKQSQTLRARLRQLPPLARTGLRDAQFEAITNLERSFALGRPRALIQMTMGSGKSFTAVASTYRLLKFGGAKRVLFLVDRGNLGKQALGEFSNFDTPDDGRKFTELYVVQHLTTNRIDPDAQVVITTIQRLYSILRGEEAFDEENEERSEFELGSETKQEDARTVNYNVRLPTETFDFIITDECHRSIYGTWRQVLEYFDAFLTGLTATPSAQTIGFFGKNMVMEYGHERAVADGVNVNFDVYRIRTQISEKGSKVAAGNYLDYRDKETGAVRWEELSDDFEYAANALDRSVVAMDQIRTVVKHYKEVVLPTVFPDRRIVPKTLIFAKSDAHADDILQIVREEFAKGNDFAKKITYGVTGERTDDLIKKFRVEHNPRVVVTVDMIATGTDIKPLEVLLFMRDVRSRSYFDQMKGRGTRVVSKDELKAVSEDADEKAFFLLVDAVGVTESDKSEAKPLERKRGVSFEKLLHAVGMGDRTDDSFRSLAGRLARLNQSLTSEQRSDLEAKAGQPIATLIGNLLGATQPLRVQERASQLADQQGRPVTPEDVTQGDAELRFEAMRPFGNPQLRDQLVKVQRQNEVAIDTISQDKVLSGQHVEREDDAALAQRVAEGQVRTFREFIEQRKDEIDALSILYAQPYAQRHVTFRQIKDLSKALQGQDPSLTPENLFAAYERLEAGRVKNAGPGRTLTDLVALVRFATERVDVLEPFASTVDSRFQTWLASQEAQGRTFTSEQRHWLDLIRAQVGKSLEVQERDLRDTPFNELGGLYRARQVFGDQDLKALLEELTGVLAA